MASCSRSAFPIPFCGSICVCFLDDGAATAGHKGTGIRGGKMCTTLAAPVTNGASSFFPWPRANSKEQTELPEEKAVAEPSERCARPSIPIRRNEGRSSEKLRSRTSPQVRSTHDSCVFASSFTPVDPLIAKLRLSALDKANGSPI